MDPAKHKLYESALIKSIRRCMVDDAVYWGCLLYKLGYEDVVWRRLFLHLSEDIGVADRNLPANIAALFDNYTRLSHPGRNSFEGEDVKRLPMVHAIMLMASAEKSRAVDHATIVHFGQEVDREVPDYCIDYHSPLGRRMGRDAHHFFNHAGFIKNESSFSDEWKDQAWSLLVRAKSLVTVKAKVIEILSAANNKTMLLYQFSDALKQSRLLGFGVEPEHVVAALRDEGVLEYDFYSNTIKLK